MANFGGFIGGSGSGGSNFTNNKGMGRNTSDFGSDGGGNSGTFGGNRGSLRGNSGSFGGNSGRFGGNSGSFGGNKTGGNKTGFGGNTTQFGGNTTGFGGNTTRFGIGIGGRMQDVPEYLQRDPELRHLFSQINQERKRKAQLESKVREVEQTYISQSMARGGGSGSA